MKNNKRNVVRMKGISTGLSVAVLLTVGALGVGVFTQVQANRNSARQLAETRKALEISREAVKALEGKASQLEASLADAASQLAEARQQVGEYQELLNSIKAASARPPVPQLRAEVSAATSDPVLPRIEAPVRPAPPGNLRMISR